MLDSVLQNMLYCIHTLHVCVPLSIYPDIQLGTSNSWGRWVLPFTASLFLVFPHSEGLGHKSWGVFPAVPLIQLWLYFRMPSWSAAVPRTSTPPHPLFLPLFVSCWVLSELHCCFLSLRASCYMWSDIEQSCVLCPVTCIKNWHPTLAFPGCLASSGALKMVQVNCVPRLYIICNILIIFRPRKML